MITDNSDAKVSSGKVKAVIFDWAGTTIDYGCFAPVDAFIRSLRKYGLEPSIEEIRAPMGLPKKEHIKKILETGRIREQWINFYGTQPGQDDVDSIYSDFDSFLSETVLSHVDIKPYTVETVNRLRGRGIRIGSTTGYTSATMDMILLQVKKNGYMPDCVVTPDNLPAGRPLPWMCFRNAIDLGVYPMNSIVKVGDTASDIEEGLNSGCWTAGVIYGSSEMGFTQDEEKKAGPDMIESRRLEVIRTYISKGAHFIIDDLSDLEEVIELINSNMTGRTV